MKLISRIVPKNLQLSPSHLFRSAKKDRSIVSRSDPSSFSSGTTSSSASDGSVKPPAPDPTSVLPSDGDWCAAISSDIYFELAHAFKLIEKDNDGFVLRTKLEKLFTQLGAEPPSQEEVSLILGKVDRVNDSDLNQEELLSRFGSVCNEPTCVTELREVFEVFDSDRDGKISAEELLSFFSAFGEEQCTLEDCKRMIAGVDKNGDGFVNFEDFALMMELQR
jgi:calcium-binding protein CML